ncbi:MAG TPA: two-component regulator propeller domain-containing protein [Salinivirgaceae bacterium]|mgnify:CR=1 FL=1|nr:two-component regulator propeller domain-containing protein [Salinivirgaceae bacterium]
MNFAGFCLKKEVFHLIVLLLLSSLLMAEENDNSNIIKSNGRFKFSQLPKTLAKGKAFSFKPEYKEQITKFRLPEPKPFKIISLSTRENDTNINSISPKIITLPQNNTFSILGTDTITKPEIFKAVNPRIISNFKPRTRDVALFDIRYIDVEQGLPSSYVLCAYEDQQNALWIGMNDQGAVRYNGLIMQHFSPREGFPLKSVRSIMQTSSGKFWFGSFDEGAVLYDGKNYYQYTTRQGFPDNTIYDILEDKEGTVWFATGNGLCSFRNDTIKIYSREQGLTNPSLRTLAADHRGNLWIGTWGGRFFKFTGSKFIPCPKVNFPLSDNVLKIVVDSLRNVIWLTFHTDTYGKIENDSLFLYKLPLNERIRFKDIVVDEHGNPFIATPNLGFIHFNDSYFSIFSPENGLSHKDVSVLLRLENGTIVVGTRGGGLNIYNPYSFRHYTEEVGFKNSLVYSLTQEQNESLWFGTETDGLFNLKNETLTIYNSKKSLTSDIVLAIQKGTNNDLWLGAWRGGLMHVQNDTIYHYLKQDGLTDLNVVSLFLDSKNYLWIGTWGGGAFMFDGKYIYSLNGTIGLDNPNIFDFESDINGDIWIATENGGLYRIYSIDFDTKEVFNYSQNNGLTTQYFNCITKDRFGNLWIGAHHNGGIYVLTLEEQRKGPKQIQFLPVRLNRSDINLSVQSMVFDNKDRLWVGTDKGLLCIPDLFENDRLDLNKENTVVWFGSENGLKGLDFLKNAMLIDNKGTLWMGTGKCLSAFKVENFGANVKTPFVEISAVYIKGNLFDFSEIKDEKKAELGIEFSDLLPFSGLPNKLVLPYRLNHLTFIFSASDITYTSNLSYRVRLRGLDDEWYETNENKIDYRSLPSGNFTFEVQAKSIDNHWSRVAQFSFRIKPPFWATWYAYLIYTILFIAIVLGFNRYRSRQLRNRQKELEYLVNQKTYELSQKNEELNQLLHEVVLQRDEIEQQRDTVFEQKQQLERIHLELTQSIDYAVRIQNSLMSSHQELSLRFPDNFVIYIPRDKVSGDFYYYSYVEGYDMLAVADCTGHGVPGAFMCMLAFTMLREIINKDKIIDTAMVLTLLRQEIINALKQESSPGSQKDGLDIAILAIDRTQKRIQFSGAHLSMYHIHRGKLKEYKGDPTTVAVQPKMISFTSQTFQYHHGDSIILFTDGYFDQFGGENYTKLKSQRFKELIVNNLYLNTKDQGVALKEFFVKWKGDYDQIDDVTVLGINL